MQVGVLRLLPSNLTAAAGWAREMHSALQGKVSIHSANRGRHAVLQRKQRNQASESRSRGAIFVEYILTLTLVGIGVIVGLVAVRTALVTELQDLADAIAALIP
jgi:hypothetical protein